LDYTRLDVGSWVLNVGWPVQMESAAPLASARKMAYDGRAIHLGVHATRGLNERAVSLVVGTLEMDNGTFDALFAGQTALPPFDTRWAILRLIEYAPYAEIKRLLPVDSFLRPFAFTCSVMSVAHAAGWGWTSCRWHQKEDPAWIRDWNARLSVYRTGFSCLLSVPITSFYLTGGTALSPYYQHRYSENLDFFC